MLNLLRNYAKLKSLEINRTFDQLRIKIQMWKRSKLQKAVYVDDQISVYIEEINFTEAKTNLLPRPCIVAQDDDCHVLIDRTIWMMLKEDSRILKIYLDYIEQYSEACTKLIFKRHQDIKNGTEKRAIFDIDVDDVVKYVVSSSSNDQLDNWITLLKTIPYSYTLLPEMNSLYTRTHSRMDDNILTSWIMFMSRNK